MRLARVFGKLIISFMLIVATMMAVAIGCENSPKEAGYNNTASVRVYDITRKACGDAIKDLLPTESLKKMATTYDAQGAPRQVEASAMPAPAAPAYEVLYKAEGGDRQEFMAQDAPEGILTVVTALVDSEGNLYFFDDPADPISGSAKKRWLDHQAEAKANPGLGDFGENEALANLAKAQAEWAKLKAGQRLVVVPPEVSDDGKVMGVHTFQVVTAPKK